MPERLPAPFGAWIHRDRTLRFTFEGQEIEALQGDSISSALWAAGHRVLGRSFKYHRPRSIYSLSGHDANVLLEDDTQTNLRADLLPARDGLQLRAVNTAGGVRRDRKAILDRLGRFTPVGFYYKAFHTPRRLFPFYEGRIREMAGLGRVDTQSPLQTKPITNRFCDILVIGSGPSGLAAAREAATQGLRVLLVEADPHPGGSLNLAPALDPETRRLRDDCLHYLKQQDNVTLRTGHRAVILNDDLLVGLDSEQGLTRCRARAIILATGAIPRPSIFRNNDLPGVMLASAAERLAMLHGLPPGRKVLIIAADPAALLTARMLQTAGVEIGAIADIAGNELSLPHELQALPLLRGWTPWEALPLPGKTGIRAMRFAREEEIRSGKIRETREIACDSILMHAGWLPEDRLLRQTGATMDRDKENGPYLPGPLPRGIFIAGRLNGIQALDARQQDGARAARAAALFLQGRETPADVPERQPTISPATNSPVTPHPKGRDFIDLDEDLQVKDLLHAAQEGFDQPELLKRYATVGMGPSQGALSNRIAAEILHALSPAASQPPRVTTARPYAHPVPMGHFAGRMLHPMRRTPFDDWHRDNKARMMHAGAWFRPEYYETPQTPREDCIRNEATAVRLGAGIIDQSTLGKLEIDGPDAAKFLERIYTASFSTLRTSMTRYALACDESGVIIDDGLVGRLDQNRFYVTTTSSGSDAVYRNMLRWRHIWKLDVHIRNATAHYAAICLAGPRSRDILKTLCNIELDDASFPYMALRDAQVAGAPARLLRVGFVGERAYEIHLPADAAMHVWQKLLEAGAPHKLRPFGIEAQRLLRLEKGHILIGQDTDALTTPIEAGMGWALHMQKPFFVGKRSLQILEKRDSTRRLTGFVIDKNYQGPPPLENHLIVEDDQIIGRITSIGRRILDAENIYFGLAYLPPDKSRPDSPFTIKGPHGRPIPARSHAPLFHDPEGLHQKEPHS